MEIQFTDRKLAKECNDVRLLERRHGKERAKKLRSRLAVLDAATTLADLGPPYRGPMRIHELKGDRRGQLSIDLDHPYRLIFVVANDPAALLPDGGLDWSLVTAIQILEIADTHE